MNMKPRPTATSAMPEPGQGAGDGINEVSRVSISIRILAVLGILTLLLVMTGVGMIMARGEVEDVRSALQQAKARLNDTEVRLRNALADKHQVIKELSAQGNRLTEFSRSEEQARSALATVSNGAEASEKSLEDLKSRLAKSQRQLRALRRKNAALTRELVETDARMEKTQVEMERYRDLAEPYREGARGAGQPGQ